MKIFSVACILICIAALSLAAEQSASVYDSAVLNEDVTWRGTVLVRGFVVVAPQATLRIDPGTVVRFAATTSRQLPNLIVQGRLHAAGTAEHPVVLTSDRSNPARGAWGGVVFLSTEKRNIMERCRLESPETGIDVRFSSVTLKAVSIMKAQTALLAHDGIIQISGSSFSESGTGIEAYNSELDIKDSTVSACQRGGSINRSSLVLNSCRIVNNQLAGLETDECRIKVNGGEYSGNAVGAHIKGGEGQIAMTRFERNGQTALHLFGSRVKVQRCLFTGNSQDAVRVEDGRSLLLNNSFSTNGGFNLYNSGREAVSARQNWWGTTDRSEIEQKIQDAADDKNSGPVLLYPWLNEKPPLVP